MSLDSLCLLMVAIPVFNAKIVHLGIFPVSLYQNSASIGEDTNLNGFSYKIRELLGLVKCLKIQLLNTMYNLQLLYYSNRIKGEI